MNDSGRYPKLMCCGIYLRHDLDGELVVLLLDGLPDFRILMARHSRRPGRHLLYAEPVHHVVFDLLYLGGSLVAQPLYERPEPLHDSYPGARSWPIAKALPAKGVVLQVADHCRA
jgi:ATP-dependent DNA ligase